MENFDALNRRYRKVGPYILLKPIGKGAYSTVYEAKKERELVKYAVKQIALLSVNPKQLERIHSEIKVLSLIKNRNIVCLIDFQQTSRNLYLVFEYCKHTDLEAYIKKYGITRFPEEKVRNIAIQIKQAFQTMRANKVVHRDLKLANILVTDDFEIRIADFGFAKLLDDDEFFRSYVGTPLTMAPEIFENRSYNEKCDLWSLGIVLYQLLVGKNPFFTKDRMTKAEIKNAIRSELKIPSTVSHDAADLLRKTIVYEPTERISFEDFFKHPWLKEENSEDNLNQFLLEEALRVELKKCLSSAGRKKEDKDFLLRNSEHLLAYEILENSLKAIEGKIMFWINLAKKIIGLNHPNNRLVFFAVGVLISHIRLCQQQSICVCINWNYNLEFPKYMDMRKLLKWEMSEYSKRLPGFIAHSLKKFDEFIERQAPLHHQLIDSLFDEKLIELFLIELTHEVGKTRHKVPQTQVFLKVKPFKMFRLNLRLTSDIYPEKTISLLLRKFSPVIEDNSKIFKRLGGIFSLQTLHKESDFLKFYLRAMHDRCEHCAVLPPRFDIRLFLDVMSNHIMDNKNEINQIFSYLGNSNEVPAHKLNSVYSAVYGDKVESTAARPISRADFENQLNEALQQDNLDEELLWLFYNLDQAKKGYLSPEDIMQMFSNVDKKIALSDIENSFKYAKIYKNKMTFEDFKEYFHNF